MLVSEAAELLLVLGEMSTELSNLCMELQSITSSSSVDLWKPPWALYCSYLLSGLQFTTTMLCKHTLMATLFTNPMVWQPM